MASLDDVVTTALEIVAFSGPPGEPLTKICNESQSSSTKSADFLFVILQKVRFVKSCPLPSHAHRLSLAGAVGCTAGALRTIALR